MFTIKELQSKSRVELLHILIDKLKKQNVARVNIIPELMQFKDLAMVGLLTDEKPTIELILSDLISYCKNQVQANDDKAMLLYGWIQQFGLGVPQDIDRATSFYNQAIALGNTDAMNIRAYMHQHGQGGEKDFEAAIRLYDQAIALDHTTAMYNRACMYLYGQGGPQDLAAAIRLLDQAIALGNTAAMNARAYMYLYGHGGPENKSQAARLFRRLSAMKDQDALRLLSNKSSPLFKFHHAMHLNNLTDAAELLSNNFDLLIHEFIEFDCQQDLNPSQIKQMDDFLNQCSEFLDKPKLNQLYSSTLLTIDTLARSRGGDSPELTLLKANCLINTEITQVKKENLLAIIDIAIHCWYGVENFTKEAAQVLTETLLLLDKEELRCDSYRINIALIVVKATYGEDYEINYEVSPSYNELMHLIINHHASPHKSIEKLNNFLDLKIFCKKQKTEPYDNTNPIEPISSGLSLFTANNSAEGTANRGNFGLT